VITSKAGKEYWAELWRGDGLPARVEPERDDLRNHSRHQFHRYFAEIFARVALQGGELVEFGCGQSTWLPYFGRVHGFRLAGIDYVEEGCDKARAILAREGLSGEIACADFTGPSPFARRFDVGVSFGVAEHFPDTAACLASFARHLKPGGLLVTVVPNMTGTVGWLQRRLNRAVYDIHVPLSAQDLAAAHRAAGLEVLDARWLVPMNYGVLAPAGGFGELVRRGLMAASLLSWMIDRKLARMPRCGLFAPYAACAARLPRAD
jgi:SAM-dependent methyltransferase